jgi:hypothetical protein
MQIDVLTSIILKHTLQKTLKTHVLYERVCFQVQCISYSADLFLFSFLIQLNMCTYLENLKHSLFCMESII